MTYSGGTPATSSVTYSYDGTPGGKGKLQTVTSSNGTALTYSSYDAMGNVTGSTQTTAGSVYGFAYGYDVAGDLVSETYPSGRVITTGFDAAGRVSAVNGQFSGASTSYLSNTVYAPQGAPSQYQLGNALTPVWTYTKRMQPNTLYAQAGSSASNTLFGLSYNWGATHLQSLTEYGAANPGVAQGTGSSWKQTYGYDGVDRLTSVSDAGGSSRSYQFDAWGNMWLSAQTGLTASGAMPSSSGQYTSQNQLAGGTYDASGNQLTVAGNGAQYDAENRMVSVQELNGGHTETVVYDGVGHRVEKSDAYEHDGVCVRCVWAVGGRVCNGAAGDVGVHDVLSGGGSFGNAAFGDGCQCKCGGAAFVAAVWGGVDGG